MAEERDAQIHAELFKVRKEITDLAKGQADSSKKMLELMRRQEELEAELAALQGKKGSSVRAT